jgi:AcrR family transcriptional regulator
VDRSPERERLLDLVVDLILREGVIDVSLSAVARKIGSNNRMLLYYFGSKQDLLDEASVSAFERFPRLRHLFDRIAEPGDLYERLRRAWDDLSAEENHAYLRLYFQRFGIAMRDSGEWSTFLDRASSYWSGMLVDILRAEGVDDARGGAAALEIVALWRGLQVLMLAGADPARLANTYAVSVRSLVDRLDTAAVAPA